MQRNFISKNILTQPDYHFFTKRNEVWNSYTQSPSYGAYDIPISSDNVKVDPKFEAMPMHL